MPTPPIDQPSHKTGASRRDFLKTSTATTAALGLAATARAGESLTPDSPGGLEPAGNQTTAQAQPEWRNRHPDMTYRMLGRTGFMVSEVVYGGNMLTPENVHLYEHALDRGLNYLDQAMAYSKGEGERAIAALLKRGIKRNRFFLTSKLSAYNWHIRNDYEQSFKSLSGSEQQKIQERADQLFAQSGATKPGYHVLYWGGQTKTFPAAYRMNAMKQLGYTAGSKSKFKKRFYAFLKESMDRTTVDHYDVLYCPHSVQSPEAFDDEAMLECLTEVKAQGSARAVAFSAHNDPGNNLVAGAATGLYDVAMVAYNIVNHLAMDPAIEQAAAQGVGIVAMKVARPVIINPPAWRVAKLDAIIADDTLSTAQKAYLFALQNPNLSAVIADMADESMIDENLALAGRKAQLNLV